MIVKDEEDVLAQCLTSVKGVADEIVIVDTGSADRTKEIAAKFTNKVYDFDWIDDFSAARNFSFSLATADYILWLDADDVLLPEDRIKFEALKKNIPPDVGAVMMKYNTGFDAQGNVTFSYYRERLTKRALNFQWREPVHEYLDGWGKRINSDICVTHAKPRGRPGGRNIEIYEKLLAEGRTLSARGQYYYARELKDTQRYGDAAKWFARFLDSGKGWIEDNIAACGELAKCRLAENKPEEALAAMLRGFRYDVPRAELCCQIGYYFKELGNYGQAAFWFELVLTLKIDDTNWGFQQEDCKGYIPCVELAVCYDKLGAYKKAAAFNEMAAVYKPDSSAVAYNRNYFKSLSNNKS
jgi:hypothetical protein